MTKLNYILLHEALKLELPAWGPRNASRHLCRLGLMSLLACAPISGLPETQAAQPIIPFTAKLTNPEGMVIDGSRDITFRLYDQAAGGTAKWTEVHPGMKITKGIVTVNLGDTIDLGDVDGDEFWVGITIAGDSEMTPRLKLPGYVFGGGGGVPVGTVVAFAGTVPPKGWLLCDGAAVSRKDYPKLLSVLGNNFGNGDGATTFGVPDLRGRAIFGHGRGPGLSQRSVGQSGGEESHLLSIDEMPSHHHYAWGETFDGIWPWGTASGRSNPGSGSTDGDNYFYGTSSTGGDQPHNLMPPFLILNFAIKAK